MGFIVISESKNIEHIKDNFVLLDLELRDDRQKITIIKLNHWFRKINYQNIKGLPNIC